jgi:hypothetical protein
MKPTVRTSQTRSVPFPCSQRVGRASRSVSATGVARWYGHRPGSVVGLIMMRGAASEPCGRKWPVAGGGKSGSVWQVSVRLQ